MTGKDLILSPKRALCAQALLSQLWVAHHDCGLRELPGEKTYSDNLFRKIIQDLVLNYGYRQQHVLNYLY